MQRRKKIPDSPRFDFVTDTAYELLLECGFNTFPISPYQVLEELKDYVTCLPWSEAKKVLCSKDPFHLMEQGAEGRTIRLRDTGEYYVVYDDVRINSPDRISWTIMHEIGHVILGHLVDFEETAINRGGIISEEYGVLEKEAHYFAAEFLMPTAILKYFNDLTVDKIALLFGVSDEAAKRKYKRVFKTPYLPSNKYEKKVIRNFYKFIITESDAAIYNSIYRMWGFPWKDRYVSICRKCPKCLSYIDDPKATYCPFCGELIDQHKMYRNMFERLNDQQAFTKIPGVSHIGYPYIKNDEAPDGTVFERITICPTCLNHIFSDGAAYCPICGQPLENQSSERRVRSIEECFDKDSGYETSSNTWYPAFENRYLRMMSYKGSLLKEDWVEYPYWEFTKWMLRGNHTEASAELLSAVLYSAAFMDDDDDVHIVTDTAMARDTMEKEQQILLLYLKETDDIEREKVEVLVAHDI